MIAVDASVLIAHLHRGDRHHASATEFLKSVRQQALLAYRITVAEILVHGTQMGQEDRMLADLLAIGVEVTTFDDDPRRIATLRVTTGLKLPDCFVLHLAQVNGIALATFDKALAKAALNLGVPLAID